MSQSHIFNGDIQQIRAVFDLCGPDQNGMISLHKFKRLYEEHTNAPLGNNHLLHVPENRVSTMTILAIIWFNRCRRISVCTFRLLLILIISM